MWESKGFSDEIIKPLATSVNSLGIALSYICNKRRIKLDGTCLKQDKITFIHEKTVNIYVVYETNLSNYIESNTSTLENSLLVTVKLVKKANIDNINILDMVMNLILKELFHFLPVDLVKV